MILLLSIFDNIFVVKIRRMKKWKHPHTITGDAVSGVSYLRRPKINDLFWHFVEKGVDVLFTAPRRVGKTSIMKDIEANARENYLCIYKDVEGAMTKEQFYQRIFEMLVESLSTLKKAKALFKKWIKKYGIEKIGTDGFKIGRYPSEYRNEVFSLLGEVAKEDIAIILLIDEFVEVILNLKNAGKVEEAISLLHDMREIRHNPELKKIIFVYAGSIGLHAVVKEIGRPKLINDIELLPVEKLSDIEAKNLIRQLTVGATIQYSEELEDYLIYKIEHLLPYFIQLMVQEVDLLAYKNEQYTINREVIDGAFNNVVRNTANFDDWIKRLKDYLGSDFPFVNQILTHCAHKGKINIQEVYDMANASGKVDLYKDLLDDLEHDGYLIANDGIYRFISPFIKSYWLHKNPVSR